MPCYRPILGYRTDFVNPETGKRGITFSRNSQAFTDKKILVPCGKCLGCLNKKTNEWALRCTHEAQFHEENCFITLTYDDDHLPEDGGLHHKHFQDFMKRLRRARPDVKIKYFMCGEYGGLNERPHFHAIIFGTTFHDMRLFSTAGNSRNYISNELSSLWPFGFHTIGNVHYGTARYTAKYSMKRMEDFGIDYGNRRPEYRKMSQGIGASYAKKHSAQLARTDSIILNGHRNPVPRYYEKFIDEEKLQKMKDNRAKYMLVSNYRLKSRLKELNRTHSENLRISENNALAKAGLYEKGNYRPNRI